MLSNNDLSRLAGIPLNTLLSWVHRGVLRPERPARWNLPEALAVVLLAALTREGLMLDKARDVVLWQIEELGALLRRIQAGHGTAAEHIVFVNATFPDGEEWRRLVTTADDLERLIAAVLRRQPVRVDVRDCSELYCRVLEAFDRQRAREFA